MIRIPLSNNYSGPSDSMSVANSTMSIDDSNNNFDKHVTRRKDPLYNDNRFKFTLDEDYILREKVL
jgi:hypothetical protein